MSVNIWDNYEINIYLHGQTVLLKNCHVNVKCVALILLALCRNGTQIDFLGLDENYDFDLQQITNMGVIKTIKQVSPCFHYTHIPCPKKWWNIESALWCHITCLPLQGDEILVECTYSTASRTGVTMVGNYCIHLQLFHICTRETSKIKKHTSNIRSIDTQCSVMCIRSRNCGTWFPLPTQKFRPLVISVLLHP